MNDADTLLLKETPAPGSGIGIERAFAAFSERHTIASLQWTSMVRILENNPTIMRD